MHKIGFFENIFYFVAHKLILALFSVSILLCMVTPLANVEKKILPTNESVLKIEFSNFSPAFAALEDEFLFDDSQAFDLLSGQENVTYVSKEINTMARPNDTSVAETLRKNVRIFDSIGFDGGDTLLQSRVRQDLGSSSDSQKVLANHAQAIHSTGELGFGSLVSMVTDTPVRRNLPPENKPLAQKPSAPQISHPSDKGPAEIHSFSEPDSAASLPETIKVSGEISLKEGLAYFGDMDVSWIVGDQEQERGSINAPDATYAIEIKDNVGEIVISLYDNKNELIGEGFIDLSTAKIIDGEIVANIEVRPINWDRAGKVIDARSVGLEAFGTYKQKSLNNVLIELYAFNEATETLSSGDFNFHNWKKSNSRSLAIASKKGYKDSIFLLDSKKEATVLLFQEDYMNSFYSYLKDLGLNNLANKGTIYGNILGTQAAGYSVRIEKHNPIYFLLSGFANLKQNTTSSNGLFAFVGLNSGEYELIIEKDNLVVDRKIVLVEENKVSPLVLDLNVQEKHLEFFNPLDPKNKIESLTAYFFDGETEVQLNKSNSTFFTINNSSQPSLLDFEGSGFSEASRTFISQNKGLQRVPLLQDETILKLAQSKNMEINKGLIIGFIDSPDSYTVDMKESPVETIVYFDEHGLELTDAHKIPYGFIMSGFAKGLSSVIISRRSDQMILVTDLICSDHASISIINSKIAAIDN